MTAKWSWVGGHIQTCSTDRPCLLICIFVFVFAFLCVCKCIWTMSDQIYSAGKAFSCSICTCFIDLVEVNMQCCLPYILYYRPLLLVSEFCHNTCAYVFEFIGVFLRARTPIKLYSADSLCLLIVSSLLPIWDSCRCSRILGMVEGRLSNWF